MAPAVISLWVLLYPLVVHSRIPPISVHNPFIGFSSVKPLEVLSTSFWVPGPCTLRLKSSLQARALCVLEPYNSPFSLQTFHLLELCFSFTSRVSAWPKPWSWTPA